MNAIDTSGWQEKQDERCLERRIEYFVKTYAPSDPEEASRFHRDLIMLVRQIYMDASKPANDQLMKIIEALPQSWDRIVPLKL